MLLDRTHRTWAFISAVIMTVATVSYVFYAESTPKGPSGGSLMGLLYGVVGSLMMIYAGLLGGRKQFPFWRLGSAQFWLRGHIWFGTLSFPIILFHAGFELGGLLEQVLMGFFFVVWMSGFFGLAMQHFMPKLLTSRVPRETFAVQIPYIRKRNRILADKMVSIDCGPVPLDGDPMERDLTRLGKFAAEIIAKEKLAKGKAAKEEVKAEKAGWFERIPGDDVGLFQDLAKHAKNEGWINKVDNFPDQIIAIYEIPGVGASGESADNDESVATTAPVMPAVKSAGSPLDQMKAKKAAGSPLDQLKAKQALSPLEQMKAKQTLSPLEQMKAKKAAADGEAKPKAMSPLEMARQAGPKGGAKPSAGAKVSPLEMARKMGAAGGSPAASEDSISKPTAKLSPLEMARQRGAAGSGGTKKASLAPAASTEKPPLKQIAPAPAPSASRKPQPSLTMVADVSSEVAAVHQLLTEKYGYADALARKAAELTREFLKTDPEADIAAIRKLFVEKYGYDESKAVDIAEKVRPFIDGSAEKAAAEKSAQAIAAATAPPPQEVATTEIPTGADGSVTGRKLSPLEMARQMGAVGSGGAKKVPAVTAVDSGGPEKKLSPLEQLKAKAAAGKAGGGNVTAVGGDKPKSPLDMIKAKAAGAQPPGGGDKPKSPLEMLKGKAGAGGDKPKSPLEMMKAKGGAGVTKPKPATPVAKKPPDPVKKKTVITRPSLRTEELRSFYLKTVRPFLVSDGRNSRLADITESSRAFTQMRGTLPVELHDTLENLRAYCEEHRQFAEQIRIRAWLHYWLAIHIPFSIALFVLFVVHVVVALRVVPWESPFRL